MTCSAWAWHPVPGECDGEHNGAIHCCGHEAELLRPEHVGCDKREERVALETILLSECCLPTEQWGQWGLLLPCMPFGWASN